MRRRLLFITKEPEFDMRGEVVLGQCEPFTSGWRLILLDPQGNRECLMVGTYTDLRRVQESCQAIDDSAQLRRRVNEMKAFLSSSVTETLAVKFETQNGSDDATKPMQAVPPAAIPTCTPGGLLNLEPSEGVLIATVVQPDRADDASYLKNELLSLLECRPKAVVMDMARVVNLSPGSFKTLASVRDRMRESGTGFALCNLTRAMHQNLKSLNSQDTLRVFDSQASALAAMTA